jgi:hypothetical protein
VGDHIDHGDRVGLHERRDVTASNRRDQGRYPKSGRLGTREQPMHLTDRGAGAKSFRRRQSTGAPITSERVARVEMRAVAWSAAARSEGAVWAWPITFSRDSASETGAGQGVRILGELARTRCRPCIAPKVPYSQLGRDPAGQAARARSSPRRKRRRRTRHMTTGTVPPRGPGRAAAWPEDSGVMLSKPGVCPHVDEVFVCVATSAPHQRAGPPTSRTARRDGSAVRRHSGRGGGPLDRLALVLPGEADALEMPSPR